MRANAVGLALLVIIDTLDPAGGLAFVRHYTCAVASSLPTKAAYPSH